MAAGEIPAALGPNAIRSASWCTPGGAESLIDAAYRFVRQEPGVEVVLFGTSSIAHMKSNVASTLRPQLPEAERAHLAECFGHLVGGGSVMPMPERQGWCL